MDEHAEACGFYEALAGEYDTMTGFEARLPAARRFLRELCRRAGGRRVLDTATGTGLYAIAAALEGGTATGTDLSPEMLAQARRNGEAAGARVTWAVAPMERLGAPARGPFDAVLCLGNSLPHLLADAAVAAAFRQFRAVLAPGGVAAVQLLNYGRILARGERIVSIDRRGAAQFVRFYDFLADDRIRFNLLTIRWGRGLEAAHTLNSVILRPWRLGELVPRLDEAGFTRVVAFGGLEFQPFDPAASETLLLLASGGGAAPQPQAPPQPPGQPAARGRRTAAS
ncbi:MAG: class I SAM-dependent methyltransferase [Lentisphaeria bacterium]|jgi:SAM-dependent methyltransferase